MRLFSLGARLGAVAELIPKGAAVVDVGADHAYLPIWLVKTGRVMSIIATELTDGPIECARRNCERWGVRDRVRIIKCDGLAGVIPGECEYITITGMGGDTIAGIVSRAAWTRNGRHTLILQPETAASRLRGFLYENGYAIKREQAVIDGGRVYTVITAAAGEDPGRCDPLALRVSRAMAGNVGQAERLYVERELRMAHNELRGMKDDVERERQLELIGRLEELLRKHEEYVCLNLSSSVSTCSHGWE